MCPAPVIRVQAEDFDLSAEVANLTRNNPSVGAVVTFSGLCRDEGGRLSALELEHYPGMAEAAITEIANRAMARWRLSGLLVIHRHGRIEPGQNIVLVVATSTHRQDAFEGASFLMDYLKSNAPFWKKEHLVDGREGQWVDAKEADDRALEKWT